MQKLLQLYFSFLLNLVFGVCRLLYRLEVEGLPHVPLQGPLISVGNHASLLDSFLLIHLVRKVRSDVCIYGGGGPRWSPRSLQAMRGIPAPRGKGRSGSPLWSALRELQSGCSIAIAAEGAIRWDGRPQPLQPGAAWLALRSGAPIVVGVLRGSYSIWPRWATFPRLTGRLQLRIGKPFVAAGPVTRETIDAVNLRIAEEMQRLETEP